MSISFHTQPAATDSKPLSQPSRHASLYRRSSLSLSQSPPSCSKSEIPFARSVHLFISYSSLSLSLSQVLIACASVYPLLAENQCWRSYRFEFMNVSHAVGLPGKNDVPDHGNLAIYSKSCL
ncbi:unnamed protein product [Prunus armeniaca]|uniref:Uncharacterized protein n=1 Tax=Prunus armeniaca TaxID=36596 RepID=A0A6J5TZP3_PRUAR|nr:unnamed protein product [Prunus armeniaca]